MSNTTRLTKVSKRMKVMGETEVMKHLLEQAKNSEVYLGYLEELFPRQKKSKSPPSNKLVAAKVVSVPEPIRITRLSGHQDVNSIDFEDLEEILRDPILSRGYLLFLRKRRAEENLLFWKEVNFVGSLPANEWMSELIQLYKRFVKPGSKEELNLNSLCSKKIAKTINELEMEFDEDKARTIYEQAQDEVLALMHWDSFQKFCESTEFSEAKAQLYSIRGQIEEPTDVQLTESDWQVINTGGVEKEFTHGNVIIEQGETHSFLYVLLGGEIVAQKTNSDGKTMFLPPFNTVGGVFGELSLISEGASSSVVANTKVVKVRQLKVSFLFRLFEAQPALGVKMYNFIGKRLSIIVHETEMMSMKQTPVNKPSIEAPLPNCEQAISAAEVNFKKQFNSNEKIIASHDCTLVRSVVRRGTIYITQNHLSFCGSIFGQKTKEIIPLKDIEVTLFKETDFVVVDKGHKHKFHLHSAKVRKEVVSLLESLSALATDAAGGTVEETNVVQDHPPLTEDDWNLILNPKKENCIEFQRGDCVIQEGFTYKAFFQTVSGTLRVEKQLNDDGLQAIIGKVEPGEVLGEMNFFTHKEASASTVVISKVAEVYLINKEYLWKELLLSHPDVVLRFYYHLCTVVASRLAKHKK